jgi:glycosyltransferase involved in cell wall biosynthesis
MPKIIVSVTNDLVTDNRVDKVCRFLVNQGFDVILVGRKLKNSLTLSDRPYQTKRMRLMFTKGALFYAEFNLRLFFYLLFKGATHQLSNDLDTLLANYLAAKIRGRKLIYDTHELYTEVPELMSRPRVKRIWERIEGWIFPKLNKVYTVNDSIADFYSKKYMKNVRVVRNVSPMWQQTAIPSKKELGIPEDKMLLIVQGAGINIDRGIEELVEAMTHIHDSAILLIVGSGDVIKILKEKVEILKLNKRVLFYGKRPYAEMMAFTHHADWGISIDKDTNMNYRFSLPNKIFDYIHASTPIICSDLTEIRKVVATHDLGVFIPSHEPKILAQFINDLLSKPEQHATFVANCKKAAPKLCWENEEQVLREIYNLND